MGDDDSTVGAPLLQQQQQQQQQQEKKRNWEGDWPKSIKYLIWNEFCERFSFYGLKTILALYLLQHLHLTENSSAELVHLFIVLSYVAPLLGAILSDGVLGKYRTILYLSVIYGIGNCVLASSAVPDTDSGSVSLSFSMTAAGLFLIAIGTGGIKPCVSAFGGDQIEFNLPEGHVKERLKRQFFSMYYFAVNAGALISTVLTPVLRVKVSFAVAFAVPAALMILAVTIFWAGRKQYICVAPEGNVFGQVWSVFADAVTFHVSSNKSLSAAADANNIQEIDEEEVGLLGGTEVAATDNTSGHWLDAAKQTQGSTPVEDVKSLLAVLIVLLPAPLFWSLSDQQSTKWVFQGGAMNRRVPWWMGGFVIEQDQMQALNPVLVLAMIPLFDQIIYPFLEKKGVSLKPIPRMWIGILLSAVAFILSGLLQIVIEAHSAPGSEFGTGGKQVSIFWQTPQFILVTAGEILFSITGLEFAYSEAPESMKSVVQAMWLFSVAGGNIVTVILFAIIGDSLSPANEYFFFAFLAAVAALVMIWLSSGFSYRHGARLPGPEETPKVAGSML